MQLHVPHLLQDAQSPHDIHLQRQVQALQLHPQLLVHLREGRAQRQPQGLATLRPWVRGATPAEALLVWCGALGVGG